MSELAAAAVTTALLIVGRYALFDELASGGMATVHLGRLLGPVGFSRTVAVKRLHAHFLKDEEFITMFMDEARIVARIRHPNVVPMVDVVQSDRGLFLVMEYVHGESLSRLLRTARKNGEAIPPRIVAAIMCGVLLGLHAAHETKGLDGQLLGVVHRDVSPQNVIIGVDGSARVLDFGIAKASGRAQVTREGQIKGKLAYMAPEQIRGQVDRRTDVFAAGVVLWEMLAGRRLHEGSKEVDIITRVVQGNFQVPSQFAPGLTPEIDDIVLRALEVDPKKRYATARELALDLERKVGLASPSEVTAWIERLAPEVLQARTNLVAAMELASGALVPIETNPPPPQLFESVQAIPTLGDIPVDLDPSHRMNGEVPSTSAVFAQARTVGDALVAVPARARPIGQLGWLVVAMSCGLALIGLALGAYALVRRSAPARPAPAAASTTMPRTAVAGAAGAGSTAPRASSSSASAASSGSAPASSPAEEPKVPAAIASATAASAPVRVPAASGAPLRKPASAKPNCEPAYTVDDVGHRHYKPECMGLE